MLRTSLLLFIAALLGGCASSPGDDLPAFGSTVRATLEMQTWREGDTTPTLSGESASRNMASYRQRATPTAAPNASVGD